MEGWMYSQRGVFNGYEHWTLESADGDPLVANRIGTLVQEALVSGKKK
jgi:hypothetical protein